MGSLHDKLIKAAIEYRNAGLSIVPVLADGSKKAAGKWKKFQSELATDEEIHEMFAPGVLRGIAIVGGAVSGNLEQIDIETEDLYQRFLSVCADHQLDALADRLVWVRTPSGGRHGRYRSEDLIDGNLQLAWQLTRIPDDAELLVKGKRRYYRIGDKEIPIVVQDGHEYGKVIGIETRGEGGYALVPPSPPQCHALSLAYVLEKGVLTEIPTITGHERNGLLAMCRLLNEWIEDVPMVSNTRPASATPTDHLRPGDDFNLRGEIEPYLEKHGWRRVGQRGEVGEWCRPGKNGKHTSATLNHNGKGGFYPWSSNSYPFEAKKGYTKFCTYAVLEHNADWKEATKALVALGFGEQRPKQKPATAAQRQAPPPKISDDGDPEQNNDDQETTTDSTLSPHYRLTDTANARRFVEQHKDDVRYDHSLQEWFVWDGKRWSPDDLNRVQEMAKETARSIYREAADCTEDGMRGELAKHAKSSLNMNRITAMIKLAVSDGDIAIRNSDWDQDPWLFNVQNGTIDCRTKQLRPHARADLITKISPASYDLNAICPLWLSCMEVWQPSDTVNAYLQRAIGFTLTGLNSEQVLIFMYGNGANGKSIFIETVKALMGDYGVKSQRETFMVSPAERNAGAASPHLMTLVGRRFVSVSEVQQNDRLNEAVIKDLTGKDTMSARPLYKAEINFVPICKLWFYGNHKPRITGDDDGIWRRFILVPFAVQIAPEDRDKHLLEKLMKELPGILNWAIEGCALWQQDGLQPPQEITAATEEYRHEQDVMGSFLTQCTISKAHLTCTRGSLYKAYEDWCKENGERPRSQRFFTMSIRQRGYEEYRTGAAWKWRGLGVLTATEQAHIAQFNSDSSDIYDSNSAKLSIESSSCREFSGNDSTTITSITPTLPLEDIPKRTTEVLN